MDAGGAKGEGAIRGRPSRVVLTPRRRRQVGGNSFPPMTVTKKPDHRGEHEVSRKTIAQGMPGDFGGPVVTNSCAFYFAREAAGALCARHSPAPSVFIGRSFLAQLGRNRAAGTRRCVGRHCEPTGRRNAPPDDRLREAIHSFFPLFLCCPMDCFAWLAMTQS